MSTLVADPTGTILADPSGTFIGIDESLPVTVLTGYTVAELPFFAATIEIARPGTGTLTLNKGWGVGAWATISLTSSQTEETSSLTASDIGYRTESPVTAYPPVLSDAIQIDARVPLDPGQTGATWGWGTLRLANVDRVYDAVLTAWNVAGRDVTIQWGVKSWDDSRGVWVDPVAANLQTLFAGVARPWVMSETELLIPLRDHSYLAERLCQQTVYEGTGTYEGDAELTGTRKPKARGVCFNVPGVLIDRTNRIYQFSDGPCTFQHLYEKGGETITFQADTTNLYSGSTSPGQYRTDVSRGLVQLGSLPVGVITADITASFPVAGSKTDVVQIAQYILTEDMGFPSASIDTTTWTAANTNYPYEAGIYVDPSSNDSGISVVMRLLGSIHAKLAPSSDGKLLCYVLRAVPTGAEPIASFTEANILVNPDGSGGMVPVDLPNAVSPPPYRVRVAYQRNNFIQNTDLSGSVTDAHRQFIAQADRYASWSSSAVSLAYANANDLPPFGGALTTEADAQAVADEVGAFFALRPFLFDMSVRVQDGIGIDIGSVIYVTYPNHALANGKLCQVVGRSIRTEGQRMTLTIATA